MLARASGINLASRGRVRGRDEGDDGGRESKLRCLSPSGGSDCSSLYTLQDAEPIVRYRSRKF